MKTFLRSLLLLAGLTAGLNAAADCCPDKSKADCCAAEKTCCAPASTGAKSDQPAYPLETCVVSGDKLGDMGEPFVYVHQQQGQPDRTILLCCKGCVKSFKQEPAKYLRLLDEAAAAKKKA